MATNSLADVFGQDDGTTQNPFDSSEDQNSMRQAPLYVVGADAHNIGNNGFSVFDPDSWGDAAINTAENVGKFATVAAISGAKGFYDTGATVANWFGADAEVQDTGAFISNLDDDLGQYYAQNKQAADLVGFIASSFIPGLGGIKVLNAGQKVLRSAEATGFLGKNLSWATGLLAPDAAKFTRLAATELAQSSATFSAINGNALKAIVAGIGQQGLEAAAFETAAAATQFAGPYLKDSSTSDIASNIMWGAITGGAIGGAFSTASILGKIKTAVKGVDLIEKPFTHITELPTAASPAERVMQYADDLSSMPTLTSKEQFVQDYLSKMDGIDQGASSVDAMFNKFQRLQQNKQEKLNTLIRGQIQEITGNDPVAGNVLADSIRNMSGDQVGNNFLHMVDASRIGNTLPSELAAQASEAKRILSGSQAIMEDTGVGATPTATRYVSIHGADAGSVLDSAPKVTNFADTVPVKAGQDLATQVDKKVGEYGFSQKKVWNAKFTTDTAEAEARYIWASKQKLQDGITIGEHDIPLLEQAYLQKLNNINVTAADGSYQYTIPSNADLYKHLQQSKLEVATDLMKAQKAGTGTNVDEIAKITNLRRSYLQGEMDTNIDNDLFARQKYNEDYTQQQIANGTWTQAKGTIDTAYVPSVIKAGYNIDPLVGTDGMVLDGMAHIKAKQQLYQQGVDSVFSKYTGDLGNAFYHPDEKLLLKANRYGSGPGLFSFANGNYHSLESWSEYTGKLVNQVRSKVQTASQDRLLAPLAALRNNQGAAIEFEAINQQIAATTEKYVMNDAGDGLIARAVQRYRQDIAAGKQGVQIPKLQEGAPNEIKIVNPETLEAIKAHLELNGQRVQGYKEMRAAQGLEDVKDASTFYPIRPNPRDYPHFAFVVDPSITGSGHVTMIHAATAKDLEGLIDKVPSNYNVITKGQSEEFHKAVGDFQYERTLHENYIDSDLKSNGVNSQFFQKTDQDKIADDIWNWHKTQGDVFTRELVNAKFEKEFSELRRMGEQYSNVSLSKYGSSYQYAENSVKNPYISYVKTALDLSQANEHPLLMGLNNILDRGVSLGAQVIQDAFVKAKSADELGTTNALMQQYGVKSPYYDAATQLLANHSAPAGALRNFVSKANSILTALTLKFDTLNAVNNAVGMNVLMGSETSSIIRAIKNGNSDMVGPLADLTRTDIPGLQGQSIMSPGKLIQNAYAKWAQPSDPVTVAFKQELNKYGWDTKIMDQFHQALEDLTLQGSEDAGKLSGKINSAFTKAKIILSAPNEYAEQMNRFVSGYVMKQLTDLGEQAGVLTPEISKSYINTFLNRVHANNLASQRPLMFQGPVGAAVGLFQSYQFNMMQQLFRYVGEGSAKDAAIALGLQGTLYGMNGLPAFSAINQHIIGTASGNVEHKDLYSQTYGTVGKTAGDWLLYGVPSNLLKTNLYSRGDINPRSVTVIPTNPADVPIISGTVKFMQNLYETASTMAGGNAWQGFLSGIEHNGISRPLAGLAQTIRGVPSGVAYSTSGPGNIVGSNDLASLATLARLAGGKPFDEAVTNDTVFRINSYQAADANKMKSLSKQFKSEVVGNQMPSPDTVHKFASDYAAIGGKQVNFNKWMLGQMKQANTPQANVIIGHLNSPYSQYMQEVMGGTPQLANAGNFSEE